MGRQLKNLPYLQIFNMYLQTTQARPISMAKSSALVSSSFMFGSRSLLVCTVIGEERFSCFSKRGFFGGSTSPKSTLIYFFRKTERAHFRHGMLASLTNIFKLHLLHCNTSTLLCNSTYVCFSDLQEISELKFI